MNIAPKFRPVLDPEFVPASSVEPRVSGSAAGGNGRPLAIALERSDGSVSVFRTAVCRARRDALNRRYAERLLKFLLWQKGGYRVTVAGDAELAAICAASTRPAARARSITNSWATASTAARWRSRATAYDDAPEERETAAPLGRHLEGCRIGFDLGASDRKCAAVIDGKVVFSDEVAVESGGAGRSAISLRRHRRFAAARRRASAAGGRDRRQRGGRVCEQRSPRRLALPLRAARRLRRARAAAVLRTCREAWGGIPFDVVNDGEVTALAGSMALNDGAVLGIAMGSSLAAGYVTPQGTITTWLNELAFVPVDYREDAPVDEWSGDGGVGAQYFSQQAVGRLLAPAGIDLPGGHAAAGQTRARAEARGGGRSRAPCASMTRSACISAITSRLTPISTRFAICWCSAA